MPKYQVAAREIVFYNLIIDAENEEQAKQIAQETRSDKDIDWSDYFEIDAVEEITNEQWESENA